MTTYRVQEHPALKETHYETVTGRSTELREKENTKCRNEQKLVGWTEASPAGQREKTNTHPHKTGVKTKVKLRQ